MGKTGVGSPSTCHGSEAAPPTNQLDTKMDLAIQGPAARPLKVGACHPPRSPS